MNLKHKFLSLLIISIIALGSIGFSCYANENSPMQQPLSQDQQLMQQPAMDNWNGDGMRGMMRNGGMHGQMKMHGNGPHNFHGRGEHSFGGPGMRGFGENERNFGGFGIVIGILLTLLIQAIAIVGYFVYKRWFNKNSTPAPTNGSVVAEPITTPEITDSTSKNDNA